MKILFLTNNLEGKDGWSRYSFDLINNVKNQGHEVLCFVHDKSDKKIFQKAALREPLKYLANPIHSFLTAKKISGIIKEFSPDIIHFIVEPYATILHFLDFKKTKTFLTAHGTYSFIPNLISNCLKKSLANYLSRKVYNKLDGVIAVSNYTKKYLLENFSEIDKKIYLDKKIKVITNGIDLKTHSIIDVGQKPKNKTKQILFVGAVKPRKGLLESIEALRYYRNNFSDKFFYSIVGNYSSKDKYFKKLKKRIKEYNLENNVIFRGSISEEKLVEKYIEADLFLMLPLHLKSHFEGFGLVYLEANAKGVPCIGSDQGGVQEAIKNKETGYIVNPLNPEEVAEKINLVLNKQTILSQNCLEWAKENSIDLKTDQILNFYGLS